MRKIIAFVVSLLFLCCALSAQQQTGEQPKADPVPQVKPGTNPNKKVVKSQKDVVFTENLEWIKVDSTSNNQKKEIPGPQVTKDKPKQ